MVDNKILKYFGIVLLFLGCIGWLGITISDFSVPHNWEMPLGDVKGIVVDSNGNVFCGLQSYRRIQVYNNDGRFLRGWQIDSTNFRIKMDESDYLHIATARQGFHLIYNAEGTLINKQNNALDYFKKISNDEQQYKWYDKAGNQYRIERYLILFPRIVKISITGQTTVLVSTPLIKWIVMGPFPAWLFAVIGGISVALTSKKFLSYRWNSN